MLLIIMKGDALVNILHMKYAVEVAKHGSLNKASEILLIAQPNLSRSIKELEADLGIVIFDRTSRGMTLTPEGREFISFAKGILSQIEQVEQYYKDGSVGKQKFSVSVPRAEYVSQAFAEFSAALAKEPAELFYKETNTQKTIRDIVENSFQLGIIRYPEDQDRYFKNLLEEKDVCYELITEFRYRLLMNADSPLAKKESITFDDLREFTEVSLAEHNVPAVPLSKVFKEDLPDNAEGRIFIYERSCLFELLSANPSAFTWVSLIPRNVLEKYDLTEKECIDNTKTYKDVLVYRNGYKLSALDKRFITALCEVKRKNK